MILTGKAKVEFHKWFEFNKRNLRKSYLDDTCYNSIVIEWLDIVGISIEIGTLSEGFTEDDKPIYFYDWKIYAVYNCCESDDEYNSRQKATHQAIIKANEIYNSSRD